MKRKKQDKKIAGPPEARGMVKWHAGAIGLIGMAIVLAYSNSLSGTWAMDDVVANRPVGIKDIADFIGFRKVTYMSFLLNQHIAPFSPLSFRLFNVFIHILNASLVYLLGFRTFLLYARKPEGKTSGEGENPLSPDLKNRAFAVALLSGIVFALHPINISAVAYIAQRMTSLAAFFVLLSLHCFIAASQASRTKSLLRYGASGVLLVLGILSKENAVMAIPLFILYDYVFISRFDFGVFRKKAFAVLLLGGAAIALASYFMNFHKTFLTVAGFFLHPHTPLHETAWGAIDVYWTPFQHVLTEFRVVARYLILILLPLPRFFVFDWWGFPVSTGVTEPATTALSMVLLFALLLFSVLKMRRHPFLCTGILWYLIALSLESFLAPGLDLYFEHRNYLPLLGLVIGVTGEIVIAFKDTLRMKTVLAAAVLLGLLLGTATFSRNTVWRDSITLWSDTLKKAPSNIRAMMALGNAYLLSGDFENAKARYREAVRLSGDERRLGLLNSAIYRLGFVYLFEKDLEKAKRLIAAAETQLDSYNLTILKGYYKALSGDGDGALKIYHDVLPETRGADTVVVFTLIGDTLREKGMWDEAIESYRQAVAIDKGFSAGYYGMGMAYLGKRDILHADENISRTLSLEPNHVLALADKADILLIRKDDPLKALEYAKKAVSSSPPLYQPYLSMGNVLIVLGREKEAAEYYQKARERRLPDYMVPLSTARAYFLKGDTDKARYYLSELRKYQLPENIRGVIQ